MPFVKVNPSLGEEDRRAADLAQDKAPAVSRHRGGRNFAELSVRNHVCLAGLRNNRAETRTQNDGDLRAMIA